MTRHQPCARRQRERGTGTERDSGTGADHDPPHAPATFRYSPRVTELTQLDPEKILDTSLTLERRVFERFPTSGLSEVAAELVELARHAHETSDWIAAPDRKLRALSVIVILFIVVASIAAMAFAIASTPPGARIGWAEVIQVAEAGVNDLVLLGAAVYFLMQFERRAKRTRVLKALNQLRTFAHLVDVHQLTKNPDALEPGYRSTESSPERELTAFEMGRYLDYCSEMLSLTGKIAALYCEAFDDNEAVEAATGLEAMAIGLQRKIWQKIMILETRQSRGAPEGPIETATTT